VADLDDVVSLLSDILEEIRGLGTRLDNIENYVYSMKLDVETIDSNINSIDNNIISIEGNISTIDSNISSIDSNVFSINLNTNM